MKKFVVKRADGCFYQDTSPQNPNRYSPDISSACIFSEEDSLSILFLDSDNEKFVEVKLVEV